MPSFKESTDILRMSAPELAEIFGLSAQAIRQARQDPTRPGHRTAPRGWEQKLATIARTKGGQLVKLAEELEG